MRTTYKFETSKDQRIIIVDNENLFEVYQETFDGKRYMRFKNSLIDIKPNLKEAVSLALAEAQKLYVRKYEANR
jgi:hypothetical protein